MTVNAAFDIPLHLPFRGELESDIFWPIPHAWKEKSKNIRPSCTRAIWECLYQGCMNLPRGSARGWILCLSLSPISNGGACQWKCNYRKGDSLCLSERAIARQGTSNRGTKSS
jgi:hypothetical protein